jgi:uncharacterized protein
MSEVKPRGRFVWYDLMTTDPVQAVSFYTKVVGWGTAEWQGPTQYTMWTNNSVPLGGVMQLPADAAAPHWLAYISSPDVDATVKQAVNLGARTLVAPTDIPTVGRYAVLLDPQGAAFAVFTPSSQVPGHEGLPELGEFSWHELATHDQPAAFRFYEILFGWQKISAIDIGELGEYVEYGRKEIPLGGMYRRPAAISGPPAWLHYIMVEDVQRAVEATKANGGQLVNGPMEVPGGDLVATAVDPLGAAFAVHQRRSQERDKEKK